MIVWVYISFIVIAGQPVAVAGNMKYAFVERAQCERMIEGLDSMKCVPLELKW